MKYLRNRHFFVVDIVLLILASYLSYVFRLESIHLGRYFLLFGIFTGLVCIFLPVVFWRFGLYARYWRYASVEELTLLTLGVSIATGFAGAMSVLVAVLWPETVLFPRSIPFIFLPLALIVTAAPRMMVRLIAHRKAMQTGNRSAIRVLVMGAGDAGTMIVRELQRNPQLGMDVVGFLDDDQRKHGVRIHGIPVLGNRTTIPRFVQQYSVRQVIIAMPTAPGKSLREIVQICEDAQVRTRIIPGIYEMLDGKVSLNQLRHVQIEDLLRREPIQTDTAAVHDLIYGKRVMITGGGGSIGSELCRQALRCHPSMLIIVGHGENSVFEITNELKSLLKTIPQTTGNGKVVTEIHAVIADIRFPERLHAVFAEYRPEIVFHAAAHKHVPLMELNPSEAITNNILGTRNLLQVSETFGVQRFVMISTDKAVNPTSMMGACKRASELLVHETAMRTGRSYVAVRFGNVLGSRGSVVLTFKRQIAAGGPVTVTHPEMRRYFMTIPEAVQLVLQAAVLGKGGEIFMLDMGQPVKIVDLARDMIELSGLEVGRDIDIVFTGLRPGEKLYEELCVPGEIYQPTCHEKIAIAVNATNTISPILHEAMIALEAAASDNDRAGAREILQALIPEYQPAHNMTQVPPVALNRSLMSSNGNGRKPSSVSGTATVNHH
ncbi:MAG: polysaccharide biosynthesis protein [Chloroflexaceae bacterium]|nr:polysaccharide biosynthesis protein [Chloroflexaceae bacterium]